MFPFPLERRPPSARAAYRLTVGATLVVWLLPLAAIVLTSFRSQDDLNRGNYWGWPSAAGILDNYATLFAGHIKKWVFESAGNVAASQTGQP